MPKKDGTGPFGSGKFGGKMGGSVSGGPVGYCQCPKCGTKVKHDREIPCSEMKCPKCGTLMTRV